MFLSITMVLFAVLPFSLASTTCTTSNAISWAESGSTTSGGGGISSSDCAIICGTDAFCLQECSSDPCTEQFGDDADTLQACYAAEQQGSCNILGGSACDKKRKLRARDTLTCSSSETCYEYTDGSLFCLDEDTGDYVDDIGGYGNVNTGEYTGPDGPQTTVSGAATATASATRSSGSSATTSATKTSTHIVGTNPSSTLSSSGTRATAGTTSASSSASTAAPTANSASGKFNAGSVMGVLGLIVALI